MCDHQSLRSACAYAQTDQSLCLSLEYSMSVKLLTEHHLEFLSLKAGCTGSSESTLVKMSNCWKSHATAKILYCILLNCRLVVLSNTKQLCLESTFFKCFKVKKDLISFICFFLSKVEDCILMCVTLCPF